MTQIATTESFAPGEYIREEIDARGWSQIDLAEILGRPPQAVNEIITGKRSITPEMATRLSEAFGTSAQLWLNLESRYQLSRLQPHDNSVSRKAKLYEIAPLKDMQKRGWIAPSSDAANLEKQVLTFYGVKNLDEDIRFKHAARKSTAYATVTASQLAWLHRTRHLAKQLKVPDPYSTALLASCLDELSALRKSADDIRRIPKVLLKAGIRFLIVEPLPNSKIDGVTFWLDPASPVIALSLRHDRIDWFWYTLIHELAHIKAKDGIVDPAVDLNLVGASAQPFEEKSKPEKAADTFAAEFVMNQQELSNFIKRVRPFFSKSTIAAFAAGQHVHPGILVGQLHHRKALNYSIHRGFLQKIRSIITEVSLTDGWGRQPQN